MQEQERMCVNSIVGYYAIISLAVGNSQVETMVSAVLGSIESKWLLRED